jgi:UDPglucose--hexose-1-phosphate uridylyltransferase
VAEVRIDPESGDWRIVAPERAARPVDRPGGQVVCPFCLGNEAMTPPEVLRWPAGAEHWNVRAVPNLFAFVNAQARSAVEAAAADLAGPAFPATGQAEVLVESSRHDWDLRFATPDEANTVLLAARERCRAMASRKPAAVIAFRNYGRAAGNSLIHPHSQLVALDQAPPGLRSRWQRAVEHHERTGRRLHDDLAGAERRDGVRVVADVDGVLVVQPRAAGVPHQTTIYPPDGAADLAGASDAALTAVANVLPGLLAALAAVLNDPAYNLVVHAGPANDPGAHRWYRWHVTLYPRVTTPGGLEFATGLAVTPGAPEHNAPLLRQEFERRSHGTMAAWVE